MAWQVTCDGNDITSICNSIRWSPKWSRPGTLVVRFPGQLFSATTGTSRLQVSNGGLLHSGTVWYQENDGDDLATYTSLTSYDDLIYLGRRMCKTGTDYVLPSPNPDHEPGPCNLANPAQVITDNVTAPKILAAFVQATIDCDPGSYRLSVGSVAAGGPSVEGLPADWPMDIASMANMLLDTGQLGIVVVPGFSSSTLNFTGGGVLTDRTGSVNISYQSSGTARHGNKTVDMNEVTNALWYLLGPKKPQYPYDITHWAGSITPTAPNGGSDGDGPLPGPPWPPALVSRWTSSRSTYGYMQEIQTHDTQNDEDSIRPLFEEMFANEAYIRAVPRTIANNEPVRTDGTAPGFFPGDLITVSAASVLGGGFSGSFRVYSYDCSVDPDGVTAVSNIVGSADQE